MATFIGVKKIAIVCASVVVATVISLGTIYALKPYDASICASTEESEEKIQVCVGDTRHAPEGYVQQRSEYLEDIADTVESVDAVIGLDDYYAVDEAIGFMEDYDITVRHVFMWPAGEPGCTMIYAEDGDIKGAIETYKEQLKNPIPGTDEQILRDNQRFLNGEYGVYALTVTAPADTLAKLNAEADAVSYVDVMYNAEVEKYAKKVGKTVSYIELPAKPDGAL